MKILFSPPSGLGVTLGLVGGLVVQCDDAAKGDQVPFIPQRDMHHVGGIETLCAATIELADVKHC
ncbi:hypothetical protein KQ298_13355 [Synechococcus sp. CS-1330]|nr:hypothetical protein [Synechococcus sp. CS-1330]